MIDELKPYSEYKESGLPWLGRIPANWEVRRNGRLFSQRIETGFPELPILEVSLRTGVRVRDFEHTKRKQVITEKGKYKRARQGDIAYNMMRMWQGAVGVAPVDGLTSPAYIVARPLSDTESRYFTQLFCTSAYKNVVNIFSRGIVSDRNRLYWEDFKQIPSPFPPPEEQAAIVRFLDHANGKIERAIRAKRKLIALLNEQKQAIVHSAITRSLDPAVKLKPSGIPWLGDVPEHWEVRRLKQIAKMESGENITALNIDEVGQYPVYGGNGLRGFTDRFTHDGHYALIGRQGALCGNVNIACGKFWASEHAVVPTLRQDVSVLWFGALIRTMNLRQYSQSAAQPGLSVEMIGNLAIPYPPPHEQEDIAAEIAVATNSLSAAIARTEREITLLREYLTTLTAEVVTGKLDVREAAKCLPAEAEEPIPIDDLPEDEISDDVLEELIA